MPAILFGWITVALLPATGIPEHLDQFQWQGRFILIRILLEF